ncbi:ATP-binding protein [Streptomyces glomeratus]|uniref:HTH luxR-type domain-containing protein n=1 Tax=Streptomyces glomeratus TaxID=284452 RepID=A0ABP6LND2_9ACTN|nr:LuxR C-terminal-related transcriptional regulator [Streptomyces glomeratus]MCF1508680.1 LuxR C-terminal-related transcriptional regulator [Streptomyces glomeratus]
MSSFIGRTDELVELKRLLRATRLLTLTGPGGVGKTRLAWEMAALEQRGGRCQVSLVELGSAATGEQARQRIIEALASAGEPHVLTVGAGGAVGSDRDRLLVLDNCEHVLDACGRALSTLFPRHPGLRVVATSREPLRLPGETVYSVGGLSLPDSDGGGSLAGLLRSDAVRLFVHRAQAVSSEFQLTEDNAVHVAALCARLDGLPLALELAAGLVRAFPPGEIHHRLDDRFSLLTCGWRTADRRHQSLRSAIEWSYDLLTSQEQKLFRSLSLLPGGFGPDAAAAVATDDDMPASAVPRLLAGLEAKSLIVPCAGPTGSARFRMLESIRCYGHERLRAEGEEARAYERLVDWMAELARPFREAALTPARTCRVLDEERDNLTCLLQWLSVGSDPRQLLLAGALALVDINRGYAGESRTMLAGALERTGPGAGDRSIALCMQALLTAWEGDAGEAVHLALQAVTLERRRPHRRDHLLCRLLLVLSLARTQRGDQSSRADLEECVEISHRVGDRVMTGFCLNLLAWQLLRGGDTVQAERLVDEALPILRGEANPVLLRVILHTAGVLALERDDLDAAEAYFDEALGDTDHVSDTAHLGAAGPALWGLAVSAVRSGRFERALRLFAAVERHGASAALVIPPWFRAQVEEAAATALGALPKARAEGALAAGRRLGPREIVDYARDGRRGTAPGGDDPLSPREREVIALVAAGLTNRQIAARLYLSVRTVETHVRNIRNTLGLRSRTHVAAWSARRAQAVPTHAEGKAGAGFVA